MVREYSQEAPIVPKKEVQSIKEVVLWDGHGVTFLKDTLPQDKNQLPYPYVIKPVSPYFIDNLKELAAQGASKETLAPMMREIFLPHGRSRILRDSTGEWVELSRDWNVVDSSVQPLKPEEFSDQDSDIPESKLMRYRRKFLNRLYQRSFRGYHLAASKAVGKDLLAKFGIKQAFLSSIPFMARRLVVTFHGEEEWRQFDPDFAALLRPYRANPAEAKLASAVLVNTFMRVKAVMEDNHYIARLMAAMGLPVCVPQCQEDANKQSYIDLPPNVSKTDGQIWYKSLAPQLLQRLGYKIDM